MNKKPLVSVIIAHHNNKSLIKGCLDSLFKIDYPKARLEIIVVDNVSEDDSVQFIRSKYPKVKVIKNDVNNYCKACNMGIKAAKGSYIALLNNDVKVRRAWLVELVKAMENDKSIGAATSKLVGKDGTIQNAGLYELPNFYWDERGAGKEEEKYNVTTEVDAISGACVLYRREALHQAGQFDEDFVMFGEDVDMSIRLKQLRWKLVYAPFSVVYHKRHGSCNEDFVRKSIERSRLLLIAKHYPYKLADALMGNGYFVVNADNSESGRIFDILPEALLKLAKHYDKQVVDALLKEVFLALKRILSYENKKLQENIKNISADLSETRKDRDHYKLDQQYSREAIIKKYQEVLEKDKHIDELSSQLIKLQQRLAIHLEKIAELDSKLKESLDEAQIKTSAILEKDRSLDELTQRLAGLQEEINSYNKETANYKEEIAILTSKLKESLDKDLAQDSIILEMRELIQQLSSQIDSRQQELSRHKEEILQLTGLLKESPDKGLIKDDIIVNRAKQLDITNNKLKQLETELVSIYQSKGFRFILNPLWEIVWHGRFILKFLFRQIGNVVWTALIIIFVPLLLLQVLVFGCERIAELLLGPVSGYFKKERKVVPFESLSVSIVIPNWNGIELLRQCLASIYEIDEFKAGKHEVLIVDDASKYSIAECIRDDFPKARVIRNRFNQGFGRSCNRGVKNARGELIVLLNNDIIVSKDFLAPLKGHFKDEDVFAVAPKLYYWDKETFNYGMHMGRFEDGYLSLWNEAETGNGDKVSETAPTIFAVGGAAVFRKRDFLWLGGFDDIYRPNCWEDIDISYRAQKRGLRVLYEPNSLMYHKKASTLNYVRHKEIKNELLFMWKNLTDTRMLLSHLNQLPKFFYRGRSCSRLTFLIGYLWALDHIAWTLGKRFNEKKYSKVSDKKILNGCMLYYKNFKRNKYVHTERKKILLITPFMLYPLNSGGKLRIFNLYKRLSQKYDIILLSLIHNEKERAYIDTLKGVFREIHVVHTKTASNEYLFPKRYKYSYSSFFIEKLIDIQKTTPIDAVHIESNELLYLTRYIEYAPVFYTEHDISVLSYSNSYYKSDARNPLYRFIDYLKLVRYHYLSYGRIDKVIALSRKDYFTVRAFAPSANVSLVPTGVDLGHFGFQQKTGKDRNLIFVGHYPHYPNEEAAVYFANKIFPLVKNKIPDARLKLVGSDPTEVIMKLSRIDGVDVIGAVKDVNPHLQSTSVFVNAFQRSAGIKGKVLEAMATGTPVVCTPLGACGIDAINGQSILVARRPVDFARHVVELLNNDDLYRKIAKNARALVEQKYDWDKIARQMDRLYQDAMGVKVLDAQELIGEPSLSPAQTTAVFEPMQESASVKTGGMISVEKIISRVDQIVAGALDYHKGNCGTNAIVGYPQELHIELTHLCNSRCLACDIWDYHQRNNKTINDELSFGEIENLITKSEYLRAIKTVILSGGEPFLRPDLVSICALIGRYLPGASIGILTNATDTETVLSKTKAILKDSKVNSLWIGSSLDGIGPMYDRMRGMQGGFERFKKTVERFKHELPAISFSATFVLTPLNTDELAGCWEFAQTYGLDFFAQFGVPKEARGRALFTWGQEDFHRIRGHILQIIEKMIARHYTLEQFYNSLNTAGDKINLLTKIYYWSHLVDYQVTGRRFAYQCDAGAKFAMVDAYGNLFICPLLKEKTIGSLRENDFDQAWASQRAQGVRTHIDEKKCSCWLVCTVFPVLSEALSRHGDAAAASLPLEHLQEKPMPQRDIQEALTMHMERVDTFMDNKDLLSSLTENIDNLTLNELEFREKKSLLSSTPRGVTIGTNYRCNASCIFCLGGDYKPFSLSLYKDYFEPRLGYMMKRSEYISLCGMGELLLVPEAEQFLEYLNKRLPDKNKIITTNGVALTDRVLEKITASRYSIQISLHASKPHLHEYLTGVKGGFARITQNIRNLVAKRKDGQSPYITLVSVLNTANIEDLPNFVELAAGLGVDSVQCNYLTIFKEAHVKLSCFFRQAITNQMLEKAGQRAKDMRIALLLPPKFAAQAYCNSLCPEPWKNIYVDTEGAVLPCCFSGEHFGEMERVDALSIWNNEKFQQVRKDLAYGSPIAMCKYCLNNKQDNVNLLNAHVSFRPEVQKVILHEN